MSMPETLRGMCPAGLERLCDGGADAIHVGGTAPGIELTRVRLTARAFELHRHDTYAIGITTAGVQAFRYRGRRHICLPGQIHVLHPDELHDGGPATGAGFAYRIIYLDPELVRDALGMRSPPFVADAVHDASPATARVADILARMDDPISDLARHEIAGEVAGTLLALGGRESHAGPLDTSAIALVREYLTDHAREQTPSATLERIAGIDRYTIARQFRRAYGTSPDRFRTMRRLDLARDAIRAGTSLADAAASCGFADQSHMTRQFRRAYGMTPGRWARMVATAA
jgi:AraC-like DNA-binding protein